MDFHEELSQPLVKESRAFSLKLVFVEKVYVSPAAIIFDMG